ncbi:DUF6602 domain-containing protein [Sphingomonas sp. PAMC 26617]|uniref:DUF6602 domain-containing protein n=1 Tax=Sphingomonas sp. PAMC 26617 TaxID=1112216 RepID=UPI000315A670|nr:DUF6602 domain-containing protein [Sphingomonas sp. PAMC 26617]
MGKAYDDFAGKLSRKVTARLSMIEAQYNFDLGDEYEVALCEVLADILPARYGVCRGSLVTFEGEQAGDDLIIYDRMAFPTLRSSISPNFAIKEKVPVEAAFAYIECKHRVEIGATLQKSAALAKAVEQVRAAKALAAKRRSNPNPNYKEQQRFQRPKWDHLPAYLPELKNELFGVVFARQSAFAKGATKAGGIQIGGDFAPDLVILGDDLLFTPSALLDADGIKASLFYSSFFFPYLRDEHVEGAAIGLGLLTLLHVISWMDLLPIDYGQVLNAGFADVIFKPRASISALPPGGGLDVTGIVAPARLSPATISAALSESWTALIGDRATAWRIDNAATIQKAVSAEIGAFGPNVDHVRIPERYALVWFEEATKQDEPEIQQLFARLLVRAAAGDQDAADRRHLETLSRFTPKDAEVFEWYFAQERPGTTKYTPEHDVWKTVRAELGDDAWLSIEHLMALGMLERRVDTVARETDFRGKEELSTTTDLTPTESGMSLYRAVRPAPPTEG